MSCSCDTTYLLLLFLKPFQQMVRPPVISNFKCSTLTPYLGKTLASSEALLSHTPTAQTAMSTIPKISYRSIRNPVSTDKAIKNQNQTSVLATYRYVFGVCSFLQSKSTQQWLTMCFRRFYSQSNRPPSGIYIYLYVT